MGLWSLAVYLAAAIVVASAKSSVGNEVLVVLEPNLKREDYSIFFDGLESSGYNLTFRAPKDTAPSVFAHGEPTHNHVILFAPETKNYAQDITAQTLVDLLQHEVNIIFALGQKQTTLTSLASEFSLILPPPGTPLVSHFPERSEPATVIPITPKAHKAFASSTSATGPVWFSGSAHALGNNPLLVPFLNAPAESFASDSESDSGGNALVDAAERGGEGFWAGSQLSVVTGFQARSGARAVWVGGVSMFSDEFIKKADESGKASGNGAFVKDLAAWTFQESLVLRIDDVSHHRVGELEAREHYTTNDKLTYTAHISAYEPTTGTWEPFSDLTDVQLEFTMLDPHIRTALSPVAGVPGEYSVTFRAPDRHGVFKFVIDYKRKGWTHLYSSTMVPVVPPRHDEYPRFLSVAWPYYTGAISTSVAFILFSALWLGGDDKDLRKKKGTKIE